MKLLKFIFILGILANFIACDEDKKALDVSNIEIDYAVDRFHLDFYNATPENFSELKNKYSRFFPGEKSDSLWLSFAKDSLWLALHNDIENTFGDFNTEKEQLTSVFKHIKYYYPSFKAPRVVTYNSNLDFKNQIIYSDKTLIISLDTYLGSEEKFYSNYPAYLRNTFNKNQIPIQVARSIAKETQPKTPHRLFVDKMIAAGQLQYAISQYIPTVEEKDLFLYNADNIKWLEENEEEIWKYLMEKEYLYSTDKDLSRRFLEPAPFTKFYMAFDNESPGKVGEWIGYKIVQSYMKKNAVSLPQMMATSPTKIFNESKYKPNQ